jgi:hypothetical protein
MLDSSLDPGRSQFHRTIQNRKVGADSYVFFFFWLRGRYGSNVREQKQAGC